jgi:formylglycine-generating enzyme required for sulfatase activity
VSDLVFQAVALDQLQRLLEQGQRTSILILDSCRDNPLARNLARSMGTRSTAIGRGLAANQTGLGTLIVYATQPDNVALDGDRRHSPFTEALLAHIATPGLEARLMLSNVRADVIKATNSRQVPWVSESLTGHFYFVAAPAAPEKPPPPPAPADQESLFWQSIKDGRNVAHFREYLRRWPAGVFAALARDKIAEIEKAAAEEEKRRKEEEEARRRAGEPGRVFRDCAECPEMVVIPAGTFTMGSPADEKDRSSDEGPQHGVTIAKPFSLGKYEVTFAEWDACVAAGGCAHRPNDYGWGRGLRPVIYVSWDDAKAYVAWLSRKSGKSYRLPSEAEWEYAARAGTTTRYTWGDDVGRNRANCDGCGSQWDDKQTAPVGSFAANRFGLHDMHGNVWEWVEDCWNGNYSGAPGDGTAWTAGRDCGRRVLRGGSWSFDPGNLRAASRGWDGTSSRLIISGFRVARTLD